MGARTFLEVLLKFWGVVILASTATSIPALFYVLPSSTPEFTRSQTISIAAGIVISALVAVFLLFFARPVSKLLMPDSEAAAPEWSSSSLLETALVALGVFFMVSGLKMAAVVVVELLRAQTWVRAGLQESAWANQRSQFVSAITELLAGYLVLRFRSRLIERLPGGAEGAA